MGQNNTSKLLPAAIIIALIAGIFMFMGDRSPPDSPEAMGTPDDYYSPSKKADVNSPIEVIRFASSIRPYTEDFSVSERAAYFEWYLKNRGFNVSFARSDSFGNTGKSHIWLLVRNKLGETMTLEPSFKEMGAQSIMPTTPEYKRYQDQFKDIFELSRSTGGMDQYAWWKDGRGLELWNKNIMMNKKNQL